MTPSPPHGHRAARLHLDRRRRRRRASITSRACATCQARGRRPSPNCSTRWTRRRRRETDAALPAERLARQQARIMRPRRRRSAARPASSASRPRRSRRCATPRTAGRAGWRPRWPRASFVGIVGEHVDAPLHAQRRARGAASRRRESQMAVQPVRAVTVRDVSASDDEFSARSSSRSAAPRRRRCGRSTR